MSLEDSNKPLLAVVLVSAVLIGFLFFGGEDYKYRTEISGVAIKSTIPFEEVSAKKNIALYNTTASSAELTCKFALSAISKPDRGGYIVRIGEGETGVELTAREAIISGKTESEILRSCHAFACVRENILCPNDFDTLKWFVDAAPGVNIILDSEAGAQAGRGYAELIGVLSFIQASKADINQDGVLDQSEVDGNDYFIYPYVNEGGVCIMQSLNNLVQKLNATNQSIACSELEHAIVLEAGEPNIINYAGNRIILKGDDQALHSEAVILRDVLAPQWIRRIYGFN